MESPQLENGHTKIANEILEALIRINLSGQELRLVLFVIRKTYGFNKVVDYIALSQMQNALNINKTRASQVVNALQTRHILTVTENINGLTKKYCFNKHYSEWTTVTENRNRYGKTKSTVTLLRNRPLRKTVTTKDTKDTKDIITKDKDIVVLQPHQQIVEQFKTLYQSLSRQPYNDQKTDYIIMAALLKKHGPEAVVKKIETLGQLCKSGAQWFTKAGWADLTIGKLSKFWNEILPVESEDEKKKRIDQEIKNKTEAANEYAKQCIEAVRSAKHNNRN